MMKFVLRAVTALFFVFLALHIKSPYLLKFRPFELFVLLGVSALGAFFTWRQIRRSVGRRRFFEGAVLLLFCAALLFAAGGEARFQWDKYRVLHADAQTLRMLGRHFLLGYRERGELDALLARDAVGGVFITRRNIRGMDKAGIRAETDYFQRRRPLLIAADQEGGIVSRLSPPLGALPPLAETARLASAREQIHAARRYGEEQGLELTQVGINLNFSPVVDLKYPPRDNPLDFHTLIQQRAIAAEADLVARIALAYTEGLRRHGIYATLKHFPGLGAVRADTHHFRARLELRKEKLEKRDWLPFREVSARSDTFIMLAHVILEQIDPRSPVSHSRAVVDGIIRREWGYNGVIVTDDLSMGAIYWQRGGVCRAAVEALNGGVDLLLIAYDPERYYPAMACLLDAHETGRLDFSALRRSARRLDKVTAKIKKERTGSILDASRQ